MKKKCLNCGSEFTTNHSGAKYCSFLCYRLDVIKEMKNRYEPVREGVKNG